MSARLRAQFAPAFSRDLKKKAARRRWNLSELEAVIDLILENSAESAHFVRSARDDRGVACVRALRSG